MRRQTFTTYTFLWRELYILFDVIVASGLIILLSDLRHWHIMYRTLNVDGIWPQESTSYWRHFWSASDQTLIGFEKYLDFILSNIEVSADVEIYVLFLRHRYFFWCRIYFPFLCPIDVRVWINMVRFVSLTSAIINVCLPGVKTSTGARKVRHLGPDYYQHKYWLELKGFGRHIGVFADVESTSRWCSFVIKLGQYLTSTKPLVLWRMTSCRRQIWVADVVTKT